MPQEDESWPDGLSTLGPRPERPLALPQTSAIAKTYVPRSLELSKEADPEEQDADWSHVDPDHPAPWLGCIGRGLCCRSNPGWFAPGEAEAAARLVGLEMGDFVNRYLVLDHVDTSVGRIEAFAPAKLDGDGHPLEAPGHRTSDVYSFSHGMCVFFDGQGCSIYEARPWECRRYVCTNLPEDNPSRIELAQMWLDAFDEQDQGD